MFESDNEFIPPPEAPIFQPTWEEFKDPLGYLGKIRPIAEKSGICKIKPPQEWNPPFAVDLDTFKFTPRVQRLNELEAKTRVKLNFLDQLAKFWELQGTSLRIPMVEKKILDLYSLRRVVNEEGGFEMVCRDKKWSRVANRMTYVVTRGIGSTLRHHYEKILYPFDVFKMGALIDTEKLTEELTREEKKANKNDKSSIKSSPSKKEVKEEHELMECDDGSEDGKSDPTNKELARLQFYGAGPKAAIPVDESDEEEEVKGKKARVKTRDKKSVSYVDTLVCNVCGHGEREETMLLCDGCDDAFHTYCLIPPLDTVPKGDWRCPKCVAKEVSRPKEAFGFEQAKREYTLQSFGEMADQFKLDYFNMPVHLVPCSTVEREFWRLVNCIEEDIYVEYGADIHAAEMGSGFPTEKNRYIFEDTEAEVEEYIHSGWNLNNLPVLEKSVLKHINADISGMKVPWCYVGMCFSSFCWHIEDHWSYSINYMHWGESKTWYGVPGAKAELLEECMKKNAPELFEQSPDLLHQLTTIMNPNILMNNGVPVVRTNQHAGEFIVTFPRAYHAGFNQGYNFAEAVNFCPADWLPMGSQCIDHYSMLHRQCVFSHDELICKMAAMPEKLEVPMAASLHKEMLQMIDREIALRKAVFKSGTVKSEREAFELLPDDERQCNQCMTTCFLSAITCDCCPNKVVCVSHVKHLCDCPPVNHTLRFRYTLDEMPPMLAHLQLRAEAYEIWAKKVKVAMGAPQEEKLSLIELKEMLQQAHDNRLPDCELVQELEEAVSDVEKCASVANQLVSIKVRTRCRQSGESKYMAKLTVDELEQFCDQIYSLPCAIKEAQLVKDLLDKVKDFQLDAKAALEQERPNTARLSDILEAGASLDVEFPETGMMKERLLEAKWLDEVDQILNTPGAMTLETMRRLIEAGVSLVPHPAGERAMAELQELLTQSEEIEEKARQCLQSRPRMSLEFFEAIIEEARELPTTLPGVLALSDAVRKANEWNSKVANIQAARVYPYVDSLETLVNKARSIPVELDRLETLEAHVSSASQWKERTARTFLKKNSIYSLLEVLSPRNDVGMQMTSKFRRKKLKEGEKESISTVLGVDPEDLLDPASVVEAFKRAEEIEISAMRELRKRNVDKQNSGSFEEAYCVCRRGTMGFMLQCELCKDWFHSTCVVLPKLGKSGRSTNALELQETTKDLKFLCPLCQRSRRPRLETILSLLVSLQKLPVRLPEGEALQCLTERAMAWQDKTRHLMSTNELHSAVAQLSVFSQKMSEQAAREKTEKIINAEIKKAINNPELQGHIQQVSFGGNFSDEDSNSQPLPKSVSEAVPSDSEMDHGAGGDGRMTSSEHAYSTTSLPPADGNTHRPHQKQPRKSQLSVRPELEEYEPPSGRVRLRLSPRVCEQLEELMMEGDLLEVSLDETQHIWRLLQACSDQDRSPERGGHLMEDRDTPALAPLHVPAIADLTNKEKKRKRKKEGDKQQKPPIDKPKKKRNMETKDGKPKERKKKNTLKTPQIRDDGVYMIAEDEDICSALKCLRPTGEEVNWVQCDRCEEWFHMICIGVAEDEISEDEDYICWQCRSSSRASAHTPVSASQRSSPAKSFPPARAYSPSSSHSTAAMALAMMSQGGPGTLSASRISSEISIESNTKVPVEAKSQENVFSEDAHEQTDGSTFESSEKVDEMDS